ncbi:hypothetical protein BDP81DRAFT_216620 [Colletotrichum phormii]|uniref:Uncharacterized protein n=1 Tax=Colletotrichum phormii TaxID=359342 RepID=A0AAI9ZRW3_9PEZI|nr:uncharacterized protein BDP81DRAFT_216620 [Colletotrichum phormii]KAK1636973.1 hypothetical protein BDP81DRAFT_216620 [Colletotrichum phormii]
MFVLFRPVIQLENSTISRVSIRMRTKNSANLPHPIVHRVENIVNFRVRKKKRRKKKRPHVSNLGEALRNSHGLSKKPKPVSILHKGPLRSSQNLAPPSLGDHSGPRKSSGPRSFFECKTRGERVMFVVFKSSVRRRCTFLRYAFQTCSTLGHGLPAIKIASLVASPSSCGNGRRQMALYRKVCLLPI